MATNSFIGLLLFFVGGSLLGMAFVRAPVYFLDPRTIFCLIAGATPILFMQWKMTRKYLFMQRKMTRKYLGAWTTLAGTAGLLNLSGDRLERLLGESAGSHPGAIDSKVIACYYALVLLLGLILLKDARKRDGQLQELNK